jgi:hypothetical protein
MSKHYYYPNKISAIRDAHLICMQLRHITARSLADAAHATPTLTNLLGAIAGGLLD